MVRPRKMLKLDTILFILCIITGTNTINFSVLEELIIGGQSTKIEEVPYQAAIYYHNFYFCAGSVVTSTQIVTAAHCLILLYNNLKGLSIRVGSSKMHAGGQVVLVKKVTIHPKFSLRAIDYDVAVVEVITPLNFSNVVQPLKLGDKEPKDGQEVKVSGWGYMKETGPPSRKLRSVLVTMVDRKVCELNYKNRLVVTKRMICASAEGKDACYGDSGGPLVHNGQLVGIVSTGEGCARKDFPGIYTNVVNSEIKRFLKKEIHRKHNHSINFLTESKFYI